MITYPVGEFIKDEMEFRGWTVENLSSEIDPKILQDIIDGKRKLTRLYAVALGRAFGTSWQLWINLQKVGQGMGRI